METIRFVFSAELVGIQRFKSQTVKLGGCYPEIEIESAGPKSALHRFKITKALPHSGAKILASGLAEAKQEIEDFWNVLSFLSSTAIIPTGEICYERNGVINSMEPSGTRYGQMSASMHSGKEWFELNAAQFHCRYNNCLLKRFNFARSLADPVSRFIALYSLLDSHVARNEGANQQTYQKNIDALIKEIDHSVRMTISPRSKKPESTYTRLRNELAHHREGVSVFTTREEISVHLERFEWIVALILKPEIQQT